MAERIAGLRGKAPAEHLAMGTLEHYVKGTLPRAPRSLDYSNKVKNYPMALNDTYGDCLAPGTRLLTSDLEWKAVEKLEVGDTLVGFDENVTEGETRQYRSSVVERVERMIKPCYDLTFEDGTVIRASFDHQWLKGRRGSAGDNWLTTEQLVCGEEKASHLTKVFTPWDSGEYVTRAHAYAYGYLAAAVDGEGCLAFSSSGTKNRYRNVKEIHFTQRNNEMLEMVKSLLNSLGYEYSEKYIESSSLSDNGYYNLVIGKKQQVIRFLGEARPPRLLNKFNPDSLGSLQGKKTRLVKKEFVGEQEVIAVQTSTRTFIAEGFASHNCTIAGVIHMLQLVYAEIGEEFAYPGDEAVKETYFKLSNNRDSGLVERMVLDTWMKEGLFGNKISAYAPVNIKNRNEMMAAIYLFGSVYLGVEMPPNAEQQFEAHQPWHIVNFPEQPTGGHCVVATGYNRFGIDIITWGATESMTWGWWEAYGSEAWVVVPEIFVEADHGPVWNIDILALQQDLNNLDN